ncbi:hypothetical protein [Candidatus Ferrigenium straubiae]|uniref:hypothetical protein n=1 Tax=Candidatus Ferrigenium straubiae TaxID=2919506 RepID=UPI003F4A86CB
MNNDNGSKFFEDIQPNLINLKKYLQSINDNLTHDGIELFSRGKGHGSLSMQFQKNPSGTGGLPLIEGFIIESIEIVEKLGEYRSRSTLSLEHGKAQRKAERRDTWILWFQKLVRWTLGTIVAVVLYSVAILASEKCDFIKIPIKDWFHQGISEK